MWACKEPTPLRSGGLRGARAGGGLVEVRMSRGLLLWIIGIPIPIILLIWLLGGLR